MAVSLPLVRSPSRLWAHPCLLLQPCMHAATVVESHGWASCCGGPPTCIFFLRDRLGNCFALCGQLSRSGRRRLGRCGLQRRLLVQKNRGGHKPSMSRMWVHLRQRRALSSGSPHLDSASTAARSTCGVTSTRRTGEARLDQPGKPRRRPPSPVSLAGLLFGDPCPLRWLPADARRMPRRDSARAAGALRCGDGLTASPPAEKATARQDQPRHIAGSRLSEVSSLAASWELLPSRRWSEALNKTLKVIPAPLVETVPYLPSNPRDAYEPAAKSLTDPIEKSTSLTVA